MREPLGSRSTARRVLTLATVLSTVLWQAQLSVARLSTEANARRGAGDVIASHACVNLSGWRIGGQIDWQMHGELASTASTNASDSGSLRMERGWAVRHAGSSGASSRPATGGTAHAFPSGETSLWWRRFTFEMIERPFTSWNHRAARRSQRNGAGCCVLGVRELGMPCAATDRACSVACTRW